MLHIDDCIIEEKDNLVLYKMKENHKKNKKEREREILVAKFPFRIRERDKEEGEISAEFRWFVQEGGACFLSS